MLVLLAALSVAQSPTFAYRTTRDATSGPWKPFDKGAFADLVSIRRAAPLPAWPRAPGAILVNGDRVPGEFLLGDDTAVILKSNLNAKGLRVPLPAIRALWIAAPPPTAPDFPDRYAWLDEDRRTDVVLLRNGDTVVGDIESFTSNGQLRIKKTIDGKTATLEPSAMAAIAFNPALGAIRKVKGPYARLVLADGTRVGVANPTSDTTAIQGTTLFGSAVEIPVRDLVALDVVQGKAMPLADLKPKSEAVEPFNGLAWPRQANRSAKHRPLQLRSRLGVSTYDSGLGTHPKTTLTYALDGKYRHFTALVGMDATTGRRGQASVTITVDGKPQAIPELASLAAGNEPVAVRVDVAKAKSLTLAVDFGPNGDIQADVNWVDALLIP